jgi:hypothetical protein
MDGKGKVESKYNRLPFGSVIPNKQVDVTLYVPGKPYSGRTLDRYRGRESDYKGSVYQGDESAEPRCCPQ